MAKEPVRWPAKPMVILKRIECEMTTIKAVIIELPRRGRNIASHTTAPESDR
jgi:hypothetical protein